MQLIDEYLKYAKEYREHATKAKGHERIAYDRIAREWERLAKYRLEVIQMETDKLAAPTPKQKT